MEYEDVAGVVGLVAFVGIWIACTVAWGGLGFMLGWLPALILAPIVAMLWPLLALGVFVVALLLLSRR